MPVEQEYLEYILRQLAGVPDIYHKKMFGGIGFFRGDAMWGAIMGEKDSFRLKVDDYTRAGYEQAGMQPFVMGKTGRVMPYWTVPESVLSDKSRLRDWVMDAIGVAERSKAGKKKKK